MNKKLLITELNTTGERGQSAAYWLLWGWGGETKHSFLWISASSQGWLRPNLSPSKVQSLSKNTSKSKKDEETWKVWGVTWPREHLNSIEMIGWVIHIDSLDNTNPHKLTKSSLKPFKVQISAFRWSKNVI